ncbi:glycosyltransferase family 4 protein [uncultured Serinicoccus sp.]|uniref:glycosyltransferase family 4 protein n=1 Tax=uncultured Serinicoccus sp. TaxID=735514 RepID=UPI00262D1811|nr:glycosyltransferase family 4 protein [uncultured Serinicoccus sp.]
MQLGQGWAAREALHDAVDLDPTNLDALEFLLEAHVRHPLPAEAIDQVFRGLASALPLRPVKDEDALAFLVPALPFSTSGRAGLRALHSSKDAVARLGSVLAVSDPSSWSAQVVGVDEDLSLRARLIVLLGLGWYDDADEVASSAAPEQLPVRALRLAARRELAADEGARALPLLQLYLRVKPDDSWAMSKVAQVTAQPPMSHYQLTTSGFPFSPFAATPQLTPDPARVLYCLHNSLPFHSVGYATRSQGLLRGIRDQGWDVRGVTRLGYPYDMPGHDDLGLIEEQNVVDGVPYHRLSSQPPATPEKKNPLQPYIDRYATALTRLAQRQQPFVLHAASNYWNGLATVEAARRLGLPSLYEVRGLWEVTRGSRDPEMMGGELFRFMARMETDAAQQATRVIAITRALKDELVRRGVPAEKIDVVPNGVDTARFLPVERDSELASRLGLAGKTVIGYVGSVLDYEGIDLLLDAAAQLRGERDDIGFLIVGDGAELQQFRQRVQRERLEDIVRFTGRVPHAEVESYYSVIDICPFPRLPLPVCEMVSPLKPFEAMAMGKTVIASDVAALSEIVTDGENGLLHVKGDAESLTRVLRRALDDAQLRAGVAGRGLAWVRQHRDWNIIAGRVSSVYDLLRAETSVHVAQPPAQHWRSARREATP